MQLNFDDMILAHSKWKTKLKAAIQGQEQIDVQTASKDDHCELGKWLKGEGKKYANLTQYSDLKTKHARFHASIPDILKQAHSGSREKALQLLEPLGEFGRASSECINAITSLKQTVTKS